MITRLLVPALVSMAERGHLPDALIRHGIRRLCASRLQTLVRAPEPAREAAEEALRERLRAAPVAVATELANAQHYEVPARFFELALGPHLKYSSGLFESSDEPLATGERRALEASTELAQLSDGQEILELGCGWGSLSLWMAEHFPGSRITAVSNSRSQRAHIEGRATERGLSNLRVLTADVNQFDPGQTFDRIVSIEMFEHVRNHERLFQRLHQWLRPGGALFVHVFRHRHAGYLFEVEDATDWMSREFFTGGLMPSHTLLPSFSGALELETERLYDGTHYQRTAEHWLRNLDRHRAEAEPLLAPTLTSGDGARAVQRWRIFFMACAELFGFDGGREWGVSHYRFRRPY